jgi:hypothetical protein
VFALGCTLPAVLLNKCLSGINLVAQSERAGEHIGLAVEGGRGFSDVVTGSSDVVTGFSDIVTGSSDVKIGSSVVIIGFSVGGFTGSVNEAHIILSPTKSGY